MSAAFAPLKFNITVIRPAGFPHSSGFNEVVESLAWSLAEIGHEPNVTSNWISNDPEQTNIVFGAELLAPNTVLPKNTIVYNLEQPSHPHFAKIQALAHGLRVWDYSATNVRDWKSKGYNVKHVPIGYTPTLTRIPKAETQDIDVLFYGWMTPRRTAILQQLADAGLKVYSAESCYGGGRDNLISRAKIVLNIHQEGHDLFEIVRVSYLLANRKCVVREPSSDDDQYPGITNAIILAPYDRFVDVCQLLLANPDLRQDSENSGFNRIKDRNYVYDVAQALIETTPQEKVAARYAAGCESGDMKYFLPWIKDHATGTCLEIGTRDGASTSALLSGVAEAGGIVLSVDIADCSHLFPGHPQWKFIQSNSQNPKLKVPELDVLLIDGDHTREGYRADLEKYFPLVKPGGLILSHDIDPEPGQTSEDVPGSAYPSRAIREEYFAFCERFNLNHVELPGKYGFGCMEKP